MTWVWLGLALAAIAALWLLARNAAGGSDSAFSHEGSADEPYKLQPVSQRARTIPSSRPPVGEPEPHGDFLPSAFVVLDVETTGLDANSHQIIQIGAVRASSSDLIFERGSKSTVQTLSVLVRPRKGVRVSAKITELTGLTRAQLVAEGVEMEEALRRLIDFVGQCPVVAFNAPFDRQFVETAMNQAGFGIRGWAWTCALQMAREAFPGLPNYKLVTVASALEVNNPRAHDALSDALTALVVYVHAAKVLWMRSRRASSH